MGRNGHAILSPSASGRWLQCPASVRMTRDLPQEEESEYAREGTMFHTLCEISARIRILKEDVRENELRLLDWAIEVEDEWREDQLLHVGPWLTYLQELLNEEPEARLLLEQVVETGIPGCWGTADAVIIYPDRIRVVDIKYGSGIRVSAIDNSQLRLYGLGALSLVDDPLKIREVTTTVWQPRMNNVSSETLTRHELLWWKDQIEPIALLALGEDAPFGPSESACRFCPISGNCGPQTRWMLNQDFGDPDLLSDEEIAEAYSRVSFLKRWAADIEDAALKRAYEEAGSVPGYKVVRSGGRRSITDDEAAIARLTEAGFDSEQVSTQKAATLGRLDQLVGPERLQEVLGDLLVKSEGRLSLALESDPRPPADALHSAKTDFAEIEIQGEA